MTPTAKHLTFCLLILFACLSIPAAAGSYGREYSLRTLDARIAEVLVWDICEKYGKDAENCEVQIAQGRDLVVLAPKEIHSRIARMLVERDVTHWKAQGFQIVLVRAADGRKTKAISQPNIQRALDAVSELFPNKQFEIVDQGLIRTAQEGRTMLGTPETGLYEVNLRQRSVVTQMDARELTVELELVERSTESGPQRALSSVLTVAVGETVVAGSSRRGSGEETLLVLLTAVAGKP